MSKVWPEKAATKSEQLFVPFVATSAAIPSPAGDALGKSVPQIVIHRSSTTTEEEDEQYNDETEKIWHTSGKNAKNDDGICGGGREKGGERIKGADEGGKEEGGGKERGEDDGGKEEGGGGQRGEAHCEADRHAAEKEGANALTNSPSSSSFSSCPSLADVEEQRLISLPIKRTAGPTQQEIDGQRKVSTISSRVKTIQAMTMISREAAFCSKPMGEWKGITVMPQWASMYHGEDTVMEAVDRQDGKWHAIGRDGIGGQFAGNRKGKNASLSANLKKSPFCPLLAKLYHQFGLRHFVLLGVLAFYSLFGGLLFQAIEKDTEYSSLEKNKEALEAMIGRLANNLTAILGVQPSGGQTDAMRQLITT